jgi:hypothetical protein
VTLTPPCCNSFHSLKSSALELNLTGPGGCPDAFQLTSFDDYAFQLPSPTPSMCSHVGAEPPFPTNGVKRLSMPNMHVYAPPPGHPKGTGAELGDYVQFAGDHLVGPDL